MSRAIFPIAMVTKQPLPTVPQCGVCGLAKGCKSPKMPIDGKGKKKILILGEAPGRNEDEQNKPFVGKAGSLLTETLRKYGIEMRHDCWITNSIICRPPNNIISDPDCIDYCRPNVMNAIKTLKPELIIPLGFNAVRSLVAWLWKDDVIAIGRWVGWQIPSQRLNAWICPTWHPSAIQRNEELLKGRSDPMKIHWEKHIKEAVSLQGRPYNKSPEFKKHVKVIYDDKEASIAVKMWTDAKFPVAFDYEFSPLKPDINTARILCCSLSDGKTAIVFPWRGEVVDSMRAFIRSSTPKVAHNLKAEDRYTRKILKTEVNNWHWDSMIAAHVIDNRKNICGLKFLSFAMLGQESYDDEVDPYKRGANGNDHNTLHKMPMDRLMLYCGLDSLLTMKIAKIQMEVLGNVPVQS